MATFKAGKALISMDKPGTGSGPGVTPIDIIGADVSLTGNITDGVPITVNLVDSSGNPVPNGVITQTGNVFDAEIDDTTPISVNTAPQGTVDNWQNIEIDVDDKNGNPITPVITKIGNIINLDIAGTTPIQVNGGASIGSIPNWDLSDIRLRDQSNNVVPLVSSSIAGSQVTLNINNYPAPSGVAFKVIPCSQYTTYNTEDEGWRMQNGWWDYVPPTYPEKVAELDYSIGANFHYQLKTSLRVGSVSSTTRFVDVDGGQTWSATQNKNYATIDKLTGLMFIRWSDLIVAKVYTTAITDCAAFSFTIGGVTYDDWYIASLAEFAAIFGTFAKSGAWLDPRTSAAITSGSSGGFITGRLFTSTTRQDVLPATEVVCGRLDNTFSQYGGLSVSKTSTQLQYIAIRKCRNLITAN